jgi:hypothetical protein
MPKLKKCDQQAKPLFLVRILLNPIRKEEGYLIPSGQMLPNATSFDLGLTQRKASFYSHSIVAGGLDEIS